MKTNIRGQSTHICDQCPVFFLSLTKFYQKMFTKKDKIGLSYSYSKISSSNPFVDSQFTDLSERGFFISYLHGLDVYLQSPDGYFLYS